MRELCRCDNDVLRFFYNEYTRLGIEYSEKAILNIRADLWFPCDAQIAASIFLYYKNETEPTHHDKLCIHRPYPNKKILNIGKRFGRKKTRGTIPIVFNSFEELCKLEKIEIVWKIYGTKEIVIADYPISFLPPIQDKIFSLWSYDNTINSINIGKSGLINVNGILKSEVTNSIYDDFYHLQVHEKYIDIIEEHHKENSDFRIDFENLEELSPQIINTILRSVLEQIYTNNSSNETVYYYRANLQLSDDVVLP